MDLRRFFGNGFDPKNIIVCEDMKVVFDKVNDFAVKRSLELINAKEYTLQEFKNEIKENLKIKKLEYTYTESGEDAVALVFE